MFEKNLDFAPDEYVSGKYEAHGTQDDDDQVQNLFDVHVVVIGIYGETLACITREAAIGVHN